MSEENKNVELKNEELEKVAGGFGISKYEVNVGDTFKHKTDVYPHYLVFDGPSGEYDQDERISFTEIYIYCGNKIKITNNLSINQILHFCEFYKNCTIDEVDAIFNQYIQNNL